MTWDAGLAKVVAQHDAGLILNHMRGAPETWAKLAPLKDLMATIRSELEAAVNRARRAGIQKDRIVIDPGIGFGKRKEQNAEIIASLDLLQSLLLPILVAPSRKSFLAQKDPRETEFATAAAVTAAILNGADIVRVHDVAAMRAVVHVADEIVAAIPEPQVEVRPESRARKQAVAEPARRDDRPPRREERPPRREFRPRQRDDRPPRRDFKPRGPKPGGGRRPPGGRPKGR
jgi:hypothetical protein